VAIGGAVLALTEGCGEFNKRQCSFNVEGRTTMHLWSIKTLAKELREGKLTEALTFKYFLGVTILSSGSWSMAWLFGMGTPLTSVPLGFIFPIVCFAVIVVGLIACFRSFQQNNGGQFIQTFICLFLPANIRAFVFCLPLYLVAAFVIRQFPIEQHHNAFVVSNALIVTIMTGIQFVFVYYYLVKSPRSHSG
jgi:hypothetical protein